MELIPIEILIIILSDSTLLKHYNSIDLLHYNIRLTNKYLLRIISEEVTIPEQCCRVFLTDSKGLNICTVFERIQHLIPTYVQNPTPIDLQKARRFNDNTQSIVEQGMICSSPDLKRTQIWELSSGEINTIYCELSDETKNIIPTRPSDFEIKRDELLKIVTKYSSLKFTEYFITLAVENNYIDIVEIMIERNISLQTRKDIISIVITNNYCDMMELLLSEFGFHWIVRRRYIHLAVKLNHSEILSILLTTKPEYTGLSETYDLIRVKRTKTARILRDYLSDIKRYTNNE